MIENITYCKTELYILVYHLLLVANTYLHRRRPNQPRQQEMNQLLDTTLNSWLTIKKTDRVAQLPSTAQYVFSFFNRVNDRSIRRSSKKQQEATTQH